MIILIKSDIRWDDLYMNDLQIKKDKHGLPVWDSMISDVLYYLSNKGVVSSKEVKVKVADQLGLSDDLRNKTYEKDPSMIIVEDHVYWCMTELTLCGGLTRVSRGMYEINDTGRDLLKNHASELTKEYIRNITKDTSTEISSNIEQLSKTDGDLIDEYSINIDDFNKRVSANLLKKIQNEDPDFFERLVVKLLVAMGYKGENGLAIVTPHSNDGGVDGIINQDPLGTSKVYVQAKRYKDDNVVLRPAIDEFSGALKRFHAQRGVFITTSKFSTHAIEAARGDSIVLIDGAHLMELMLQYHVGVQVKQKFELFEIDEDFFDN